MIMLEILLETYENLLLMDGFDDCIIGVGESCGQPPRVIYDSKKVIQRLVEDGLDYEEAVEWFNFNQLGAYMGERTPIFLLTD